MGGDIYFFIFSNKPDNWYNPYEETRISLREDVSFTRHLQCGFEVVNDSVYLARVKLALVAIFHCVNWPCREKSRISQKKYYGEQRNCDRVTHLVSREDKTIPSRWLKLPLTPHTRVIYKRLTTFLRVILIILLLLLLVRCLSQFTPLQLISRSILPHPTNRVITSRKL